MSLLISRLCWLVFFVPSRGKPGLWEFSDRCGKLDAQGDKIHPRDKLSDRDTDADALQISKVSEGVGVLKMGQLRASMLFPRLERWRH